MPNLNLENTLKHLDALRGTITTIEEPLRANLPPTRAVEAAKELSAIGREHFDAYLKTFADHDDTLIIDLADRAMAYWAADAKLVDKAKQEVGERAELYVKAGFMKDRAATVLNAIFPNDDEVGKTLATVRPGTGYADRANDCNRLFVALAPRRGKVVASGLMTADEIERLGAIAPRLLEPVRPDDADAQAADRLRDQAFTYFIHAWKKAFKRLDLVISEEGQDIKLPSLYR